MKELKGWNQIIYRLILSKFENSFTLKDINFFIPEFKKIYPKNLNIDAKIRQTLQNLRKLELLEFTQRGLYTILKNEEERVVIIDETIKPNINDIVNHKEDMQEMVYLLSNESIPGWVKIGRTSSIDKRLKDLYNTSVPLPFRLEESIRTFSHQGSITLEKSIHNIIDTINPDLRKNTEAKSREFFKLSVEEAKQVFSLVKAINSVEFSRKESLIAS